MTEELRKQGGVDDAVAAGLVEKTPAVAPELDDAAKAAAEREARRQALYEENERAEDERARAEAERMRDVGDEDEDETPRDTWATVRRLVGEGAIKRRIMDMGITKGTDIYVRKVAPIGASISCSRALCSMSSLTLPRRHIAPA